MRSGFLRVVLERVWVERMVANAEDYRFVDLSFAFLSSRRYASTIPSNFRQV
jgi:hypothetical protein